MSFLAIKKTLINAYQDLDLGLDSAYENRAFNPSGNAYASVSIVPASNERVSLGQIGQDEHLGFMQISLNFPSNTGDGDLLTYADKILTYFYSGRTITYDNQPVFIMNTQMTSPKQEESYFRAHVTVNYRARVRAIKVDIPDPPPIELTAPYDLQAQII